MKMMMRRMGRNMLFLILLTAIANQLCSCGYESSISTAVTNSYSLSGQVTSGSSGLAGVTITISGADQGTATSDATGNYIFSGLANGSYTVTPATPGFIFSPLNSVRIVNGANLGDVNFSALPAATVSRVACPAVGTSNVTIQDYFFSPSLVTISVNSIVKWTNNGPSPHTVTSIALPNLADSFDSGSMGAGESVCYQFLVTGTYPYICSIYPIMSGNVVVR